MREGTLLHAGEEHDRIFKALGGMQGHHRDLAGILVLTGQPIGIRHQCGGFQESRQCGVRRVLFEFRRYGLQLRKIIHA